MRPPPREQGRIIKLETEASSHEGQCIPAGDVNWGTERLLPVLASALTSNIVIFLIQ